VLKLAPLNTISSAFPEAEIILLPIPAGNSITGPEPSPTTAFNCFWIAVALRSISVGKLLSLPTPALLKSVTIYYSCLLLTPLKKQTVYKPYQLRLF